MSDTVLILSRLLFLTLLEEVGRGGVGRGYKRDYFSKEMVTLIQFFYPVC